MSRVRLDSKCKFSNWTYSKGPTQTIFKKNFKNTPMLILFTIVQGLQKYIWLVYQTHAGMGIIFKSWRRVGEFQFEQFEFSVGLSSTLKNNSHSGRRLTDKSDIFLKSLNNSAQNEHSLCCIGVFFWGGPWPFLVLHGKLKNTDRSHLRFKIIFSSWPDSKYERPKSVSVILQHLLL